MSDDVMRLQDLPFDVLGNVFKHVDLDESLAAHFSSKQALLRCVSQYMRQAVDATAEHLSVQQDLDAEELTSILQRFRGVHAVQLHDLAADTADMALTALAALPGLWALDMPVLRRMQLKGLTRLSRLTSLELRGCEQQHYGVLVAALPHLTDLHALTLSDSSQPGLPAAGVQQLSVLTKLTHLDLGTARCAPQLALQLSSLQSLSLRLHASSKQTVSGMLLAALQGLVHMRRLLLAADLDDNRLPRLRLSPAVLVTFHDTQSQAAAKELQWTKEWRAQDCFVSQQLQHLPRIESLHIVVALAPIYTWQNRYGGWDPAADSPLNPLTELRLSASVVSGSVAQPVAAHLRVLHLDGCNGELAAFLQLTSAAEDISLQGVHAGGELLQSLGHLGSSLRRLDIRSMRKPVTDEHLQHLTTLFRLTCLRFCHAPGRQSVQSGDALLAVAASLTALRRLQLSNVRAPLADQGLAVLSELTQLTNLRVSAQRQGGSSHGLVTGSWIAALAAAGVPLRKLRLGADFLCSGRGVEEAIGRLTQLTSLRLHIDRRAPPPPPAWQLRDEFEDSREPAMVLQLHLLGAALRGAAVDTAADEADAKYDWPPGECRDRCAGLRVLIGWLVGHDVLASVCSREPGRSRCGCCCWRRCRRWR